jgi:hypothetical protein
LNVKKQYEFASTVCVEGKKFFAGDVIEAGDIPADHLESCLRVGHIREIDVNALRVMADEARKAAEEIDQQAAKLTEPAAVNTTPTTADTKKPAKGTK